jgi:hypothetical protein
MTSMFDLITLTDRASVMHLAWASRFEILIHAKASDCHSFEVSAQFRDILLFFLMPKLTLLLLNWWYAKEPANNGMQIRQNALKWVLIYKTFPGVTPQNPHLGWKSRGRGVTCTKCPVKCPLFFKIMSCFMSCIFCGLCFGHCDCNSGYWCVEVVLSFTRRMQIAVYWTFYFKYLMMRNFPWTCFFIGLHRKQSALYLV